MRTRLGRLLTACCSGVLACAGVPARTPPERMPEAPAAFARPEPDPGCRARVCEALVTNGLERVTVKLAREPGGTVRVVDFLSPDLTPAQKVELDRAYGRCAWSAVTPPRVPASEIWTDTTSVQQVTPVIPASQAPQQLPPAAAPAPTPPTR